APLILGMHCVLDLNSMTAGAWDTVFRWRFTHLAMAEALVASLAFFFWISLFFALNEVPALKRFRFVARSSLSRDEEAKRPDWNFRPRVAASLPVYLAGIWALHTVKSPTLLSAAAPSAIRLVMEVLLGIFAYDFFMYWVHLGMHRCPHRLHSHDVHHQLK
ncbi:unnamed protein product, partial [Polarella glacialis]